jgi:hypothetical protein
MLVNHERVGLILVDLCHDHRERINHFYASRVVHVDYDSVLCSLCQANACCGLVNLGPSRSPSLTYPHVPWSPTAATRSGASLPFWMRAPDTRERQFAVGGKTLMDGVLRNRGVAIRRQNGVCDQPQAEATDKPQKACQAPCCCAFAAHALLQPLHSALIPIG